MDNQDSNSKACWRCKKSIDVVGATWTYCAYCGARLRDTRTASAPQGMREVQFLRDLYYFGWWNHEVAAVALYDGVADISRFYTEERRDILKPRSDPPRAQQILRTKIFAEFIALLEAFGVLCLSIRNRRERSILWTYLNTEPQEVKQFYDNILSSNGNPNILKLLKLPSISQIDKAIISRPGSSLSSAGNLNQYFRPLCENIRISAEMYRDNNIRIYNKIKHVFSVIEGEYWVEPPIASDEVAILIEDTGLTTRLPMSQERADREINNIRSATRMGAEILAMCLSLAELGLLLPTTDSGNPST